MSDPFLPASRMHKQRHDTLVLPLSLLTRAFNDAVFLRGALGALRATKPIARNPTRTIRDVLADLAVRHGERLALLSDQERLSYRGLEERSNRYARWARSLGIGKGDVVALMMTNRPDYLAIWLGIAKAGAATALINTNQAGAALAHSLRVVNARWALVEHGLVEAFESGSSLLDAPPLLFVHGESASHTRIDTAIEQFDPSGLVGDERVPLTINDQCIYVYTSGTTGMPKAANINHYRIMLAMLGFSGAMGGRPTDRMYNCLPMYHTNGGVLAPGAVLMAGGSCFIREKFSATGFWQDIVDHHCTMFVYIGELCRYLLNTAPQPAESKHKIRLCFGNGLRPDIWRRFRERFHMPRIVEFYAATEGNCTMFNFDGTPGAVGRIPTWLERRFPIKVVQFDYASEAPGRNEAGRCTECVPDEVGEVIGKIVEDPERPAQRFEGYADKAATEKKILRDVFEPGDAWFRTGDLLRRDRRGRFYFVDRIGDTYRWKGENIATSEVSEALTAFPGVQEASVYGVPIPGLDGKAGMATIVADNPARFDRPAFFAHCAARLTDVARPVFLRLSHHLDVTGTYKPRKILAVAEGFDPAVVTDPIFVVDPAQKSYRLLDRQLYEAILSGTLRL